MGWMIGLFVIQDLYHRLKRRQGETTSAERRTTDDGRRTTDLALFLDLSILLFLAIMPFSYFCWEKYFLPIIPFVTMRMLMLRRDGDER
jgi:polyferredoxin